MRKPLCKKKPCDLPAKALEHLNRVDARANEVRALFGLGVE